MPFSAGNSGSRSALRESDSMSSHVDNDLRDEREACPEAVDIRPTVFVVDDDAETRDVLRALVSSDGLVSEVYADASAFLKAFDPERCGCLILDARMHGMSGLELQKELTARRVSLPVIITTGYADLAVAIEAMRGGAFDVVEKPFVGQRLLDSVRQAIARHVQVCRGEAESQEIRRRYARLTAREREVLDLVVTGMTSRGIASRLGLQEKTIEVYRSRIKGTMQARNAADLVRLMGRISQPV